MGTLLDEADAPNFAMLLLILLCAAYALAVLKAMLDLCGAGEKFMRQVDKAWRRGTKITKDNHC